MNSTNSFLEALVQVHKSGPKQPQFYMLTDGDGRLLISGKTICLRPNLVHEMWTPWTDSGFPKLPQIAGQTDPLARRSILKGLQIYSTGMMESRAATAGKG